MKYILTLMILAIGLSGHSQTIEKKQFEHKVDSCLVDTTVDWPRIQCWWGDGGIARTVTIELPDTVKYTPLIGGLHLSLDTTIHWTTLKHSWSDSLYEGVDTLFLPDGVWSVTNNDGHDSIYVDENIWVLRSEYDKMKKKLERDHINWLLAHDPIDGVIRHIEEEGSITRKPSVMIDTFGYLSNKPTDFYTELRKVYPDHPGPSSNKLWPWYWRLLIILGGGSILAFILIMIFEHGLGEFINKKFRI